MQLYLMTVGFSEMFERNPLAVKSSSSKGIGISEPSGGVAQSQMTSMCATGGLTQKQSLRGLLLMHQVRNLRVGGQSFCYIHRVIQLQRQTGTYVHIFLSLFLRHLARKVQLPCLGVIPRVFRSVSWSRNGLDNHGGYSSRIS